jgi:hypothetical protein
MSVKRALDPGIAFVLGVPFFACNLDDARQSLSYANSDLRKI